MDMDVAEDIQAPSFATLDLYCDRVASAVGRLSVHVFGVPRAHGKDLAHHLGRAFQLTNILRDVDEDAEIDRLYLPREALVAAGIQSTLPKEVVAHPALGAACQPVIERAKAHFATAYKVMALCPRASVKAPRIMGIAYHGILDNLIARGFAAPRQRVSVSKLRLVIRDVAIRLHLMPRPKIHIIGAGLAGLAAAVRLADGTRDIVVYEAARQAGGRCRSYYEPALDLTIDNGNHLLLSGNYAVRDFLKRIGSENALEGPKDARFPFVDLATGERWVLHPNGGVFPWWIFVPSRRVPGTKAADYLGLLGLLKVREGQTLGEVMACEGLLYERLWGPFFLAVLNTEPKEGAATLAAAVTRETLMKGAGACRPLVAAKGPDTRLRQARLALSGGAESGGAVRTASAGLQLRRCACVGARSRRDKRSGRGRRRDYPCRARVHRGRLGARTCRAAILSRHRQCAFQDRAAVVAAADSGCHQWADRVAVRLSGSAFGDDQRGGSAA